MHGENDGLVQDCGNFNVLAMELLQFCPKPSKYANVKYTGK